MKKLVYLVAIFILSACGGSNAFEQTPNGLKYQFITKNENAKKIKSGEIAEISMKYYLVSNDSLLFNTDELPKAFKIQINESKLEGGSFEEGVLLMSKGDSIHFFVDAKQLFEKTMRRPTPKFVKENDQVRFELKLIGIQTMKEVQAEQEALYEKNKNNEKEQLEEYVKQNNIKETPTSSGLYIVYEKRGNGPKTIPGKKVTVHYTGTFINGEKFDSSVDRNQPFEFLLGAGKVIPAWDETVALLRVGDKVKIIAPSNIAYGPKGYPGAIPPYSTLIFEIEVLSIGK